MTCFADRGLMQKSKRCSARDGETSPSSKTSHMTRLGAGVQPYAADAEVQPQAAPSNSCRVAVHSSPKQLMQRCSPKQLVQR